MIESDNTVERRRLPASAALLVLLTAFLAIDTAGALLDPTPLTRLAVYRTIWLLAITVPLAFVHVRLPNGYLTLSGIATAAAAITLNPRMALVVAMVAGILTNALVSRASLLSRATLTLAVGAWAVTSASVTMSLRMNGAGELLAQAAGLTVFLLANGLMTSSVGSAVLGISVITVIRQSMNRHLAVAFSYVAVSAVLIRNLLDGTPKGYLMATLVATLSLSLADAVAGRQLSRNLLARVSDLERYLVYSRVVEGTIHNVRNSLAVALGNLDEADAVAEARDQARHQALSKSAVRDAVDALNALESGASPKVSWSSSPHDLLELCQGVAALVEERARGKRVHLDVRQLARPSVYCDPVLIRQVVANLLLNAIDSVAAGGHVWLDVGWRLTDAIVSVTDDGPGVLEKFRDRLFEPHFTTKPGGTGIGLFVSYGIAREHHGDLRYEGGPRGAVFTLLLKRDGREQS